MHHHDGTIECANRCGNLTMEDSEFCESCEEMSKEICMECNHTPNDFPDNSCRCVCHITGEAV